MTAIFEEISITWDGKEYTVKPTYELINRIEGQGVSIASVANRAARGEAPLSHVALMFAMLLRQAGCNVSPADVYAYMHTKCEPAHISQIVTLAMHAFFPKEKESGNEPAPTAEGE